MASNYSPTSPTMIHTPWTTSIDEELENDDRFRCLFSEAVVVLEDRAATDRAQVEVNPVTYCIELGQKLKKFKDNFDQQTTREEFLRTQTADTQTLTSLETRILDRMDVQLLEEIPPSHCKCWKDVNFHGETFSIPMIENPFMTKYETIFQTIIDLQAEQLAADRSLKGERIDVGKTKKEIQIRARYLQRGFARDPRRTELNVKIVTALILTTLRKGTRRNLESYLKQRTVLDDELTSGMFIQTNRDELEVQDTSMIRPDSIGVELKVIYNLGMEQLQMLIKYLFSADPYDRMDAKIRLLSSVKSEIRNDVVVNPRRVFEHAIREHFLTRREMIELIFSHHDRQSNVRTQRCPQCRTPMGTARQSIIPHKRCKIVDWLVDHLGCIYENDSIVVPAYMYVAPGIARYAREAYGLRTRLQTEPFFGKTNHEFVAYTIDNKGRPCKVAHQGTKTVRVDTHDTHVRTRRN